MCEPFVCSSGTFSYCDGASIDQKFARHLLVLASYDAISRTHRSCHNGPFVRHINLCCTKNVSPNYDRPIQALCATEARLLFFSERRDVSPHMVASLELGLDEPVFSGFKVCELASAQTCAAQTRERTHTPASVFAACMCACKSLREPVHMVHLAVLRLEHRQAVHQSSVPSTDPDQINEHRACL